MAKPFDETAGHEIDIRFLILRAERIERALRYLANKVGTGSRGQVDALLRDEEVSRG